MLSTLLLELVPSPLGEAPPPAPLFSDGDAASKLRPVEPCPCNMGWQQVGASAQIVRQALGRSELPLQHKRALAMAACLPPLELRVASSQA